MNGKISLFHGSDKIIEQPEFGLGNVHNDYGRGFYCTQSIDMAMEWACRTPKDGFVNIYTIDMGNLSVLNLEEGYHVLNWLAILLENRTFEITSPLARNARKYILERFLPDYRSCDVVIGYRADDSYFSFAKAFLNNTISLQALSHALRLGKLGLQVCLKSVRAFSALEYEGMHPVRGGEYSAKRELRDRMAREDYFRTLNDQQADDAVYVVDIIRQKWTNDDERLR